MRFESVADTALYQGATSLFTGKLETEGGGGFKPS